MISLVTYESTPKGIQALAPLSLLSKGSLPVAWDEAVIWELVMLPSIIPRGSSHDATTNKTERIRTALVYVLTFWKIQYNY